MSQASRQRAARQRARRSKVIGATAAVALAIAAAVGFGVLANRGSPGPKAQVEVSMTDYAFDPHPIEVAAGDVRFVVKNDGQIAHDLVLPELGKGTADQRPGNTRSFDVTLRPGTYLVVCDLPGHRAAGMVTQLVVR